MLSSVKNVFKVPDLRGKVLFTILMIMLYRFGAFIPVPGVDLQAVKQLKDATQEGGTFSFLNLFSGGALSTFAIFALGIMPYITSSIIMQILGVVVPKLEEWQSQGAVGQRKITQWTRYLAIVISLIQATAYTLYFARGGSSLLLPGATQLDVVLLPNAGLGRVLLSVMTLTAGACLLMWMGEAITQRGIGNGMSIMIFSSVVAGLPAGYDRLRRESGIPIFLVMIAISIVILVAIVFIEQGQRRIPVQFAKRVVGRRMYGGQSTYIPLKINQSGIIPIIFASSVLYLPTLLANVANWDWLTRFVDTYLVDSGNWLHLLVYGTMIVAFAYFYNAIAFDPVKQADQIRKQGGFIPGIRPGPQTERYLAKVLNRLTLPGALFIAMIALLPGIVLAVANVSSFPFGGTTVLIAVGVALETMKQIDSQLMMRNYEGFLK